MLNYLDMSKCDHLCQMRLILLNKLLINRFNCYHKIIIVHITIKNKEIIHNLNIMILAKYNDQTM